jgi:hypothetical protein
MARYYFDVINSQGPMADDEGEELRSHDDVRAKAWQMARDLANDEMPDQNSTRVAVNVRDETDFIVFSAELSYSTGWRS